jgi:multidrug efflux pump
MSPLLARRRRAERVRTRIAEVCIERPCSRLVMSLVIVLFGAISMARLTNRELPAIDPPIVSVTTVFRALR